MASAPDPHVPFSAGPMSIEPGWIDYNGHLNMAYYNVLFDRMVDHAFDAMDVGIAYVKRENASFFSLEAHVCYLGELTGDDEVRLTLQILDRDDKRLHVFEEMYRRADSSLSATSESLLIHVDLATRRAVPWPPAVEARIAPHAERHRALARPARAGRSIGIPRRSGREHAGRCVFRSPSHRG